MSEYVTKSIGEALFELMKTKEIEKITADELTRAAGIGRATYFRNFKSKEDVLSAFLIWEWRKYEKELRLKDHPINSIYRLEAFFSHCYDIRDYQDVIIKQNRTGCILEAYEIVFSNRDLGASNEDYEIFYMAYGLFGVMLKWAKNGYVESPKEMAEIFATRILSDYKMEAFKYL